MEIKVVLEVILCYNCKFSLNKCSFYPDRIRSSVLAVSSAKKQVTKATCMLTTVTARIRGPKGLSLVCDHSKEAAARNQSSANKCDFKSGVSSQIN